MQFREGEAPEQRIRTDRFFCIEDAWFFKVREGAMIGPFASRAEAESGMIFYFLENGITVLSPSQAQLETALNYELRYSRSVISLN